MRETDDIVDFDPKLHAKVFFVDDIPGGLSLECQGCMTEFDLLDDHYGEFTYCPHCRREILYPSGAEW